MGVMDRGGPSRVLEGIHGVQLVGQPTYRDETLHCGEFVLETCDGPQVVGTSQRLLIPQMWHQRPACLRPIRCRLQGDQNIAETIANVLTSLPFVFLGFRTPRKNLSTSLYANSLIGVGIASSLYHCSRGEVRKILRWADYTMIAATTVVAFARKALTKPELRMAHNLHTVSSLLGGALFIADDCFPQTPFIHAAWHLAAAIGVGTCNKLLE